MGNETIAVVGAVAWGSAMSIRLALRGNSVRLWVRETWCECKGCTGRCFRADCTCEDVDRWRPSIHMPRRASRIDLEITDVRVERVQEITWEDAVAEGCDEEEMRTRDLEIFADLWDASYEKRGHGWDTNPWVWCLTFRRIEP